MEIVEFIRQQLDEDERIAKAAGGHSLFDGTGIYIFRNESVGRSETVVIPSHLATHIARWDPARVLRRVEAARLQLDSHKKCNAGCYVVKALALSYAGLPGYREEWRP